MGVGGGGVGQQRGSSGARERRVDGYTGSDHCTAWAGLVFASSTGHGPELCPVRVPTLFGGGINPAPRIGSDAGGAHPAEAWCCFGGRV